MDIIMIRHGETEDNLSRIYSRDNTPLTAKGRSEILSAKKLLQAFKYEKVYYSPLTRTVESKEILDLKGKMEEEIREIDFGIFTGKTYQEISKLYPDQTKKWTKDPINYRIPKGESVKDVYNRVQEFLEGLIEKDENVLLVCHDCVIRLMLCWIFDNPDYFFRFKVDNGSINVVSVEDDYKYIKTMNYNLRLEGLDYV